MSWPGADSTLEPLVVAVGLLGALATAIAFLSLRQATRKFSPEAIVFVFNLILCGFVLLIPSVPWIVPNFWQGASVLGVAATGLGGQLCLTRAFARLPATVATGINPSVLLFGVLLDWLLEGDSPTQSEWLSYLLIILGVWGIIPRSPAPKPN
ncbi:MAG: DMT family transporter [Chloroflexaceae bacterium]|nr:DMT family transporter [Chloroflexaceae bacterium]